MKEPLKMLKAFSDIDDDLIMEANDEALGVNRKPFLNLDFRKLAPVMAVMVLALTLTITHLYKPGDIMTGGQEVTVSSLSEAEKIASFPISVPQSAAGKTIGKIGVIEDILISVYYGQEENVAVIIVKGEGSDDISGDYNEYAEQQVFNYENLEITAEGNDGLINKAIWTNDRFSFAVLATDGLSLNEIKEIIKEIK